MNLKNIKALQISLASPEQILGWSHGEITKSETINYKTLKPERDGLFDETVFGPIKDYECSCGRYKKVKYRGKVCEKCGVEIIESIVRRERMGHINLACPIAHIWMSKELPSPSKISLVLDISYKEVEEVIYFVNYIVMDNAGNNIFANKQVIDLSNPKTNKANRTALRTIIAEIIEKLKEDTVDYNRAKQYHERLRDSALPFSIEEVFSFIRKYTNIQFGIGAEAILELLRKVDLPADATKITEELSTLQPQSPRFKKLMNRLEVIKWFIESKIKPEWMILKVIPVTPPDTRPIIQLDGGRFTTSDINNFYRKIIIRNDRLKRLMDANAPTIILNNEKRMLQESVDALFDNASRSKPVMSKDKRPLKSLSDHLKGKQGLFRQNLLGKRVDYSGRSVIVIGPELKMYEVGIPSIMILKLFKPFIIRELIRKYDDFNVEIKPIASNIRLAEKMILKQDNLIWPIVEKVIKQRPVLLNRAPTLHRLGIQAFEPKMIDGNAIRLHPLVTTAFNADFDGDQMAVHVPLSNEAVAEARDILLASWHILGPKDGKPVITPTQDMILGIYYITKEVKDVLGQAIVFNDPFEATRAYESNQVDLHAIVGISTNAYPNKGLVANATLITTVGKIIFNNIFPDTMPYMNSPSSLFQVSMTDIVLPGNDYKKAIVQRDNVDPFAKKALQLIIATLYSKYEIQHVSEIMDRIKDIGFDYSTKSSTTVSAFDLPHYEEKQKYFVEADAIVARLKKQFEKGLLTDDERYKRVVSLWTDVKNKVSQDIENIMKDPAHKDNSVIVMANSGARGNVSQFTQLLGMRGLMSKSYNYDQKTKSRVIKDTIEVPIKHSFIEGLTINEYFNSSYGARKGMADTAMKTSKSGYMTRKLVDAVQEIIIKEQDCGTNRGLIVEAIVDTKQNSRIEQLWERIANRFAFSDIINPKTNTTIIKKGEIITPDIAHIVQDCGITKVEVRSVLHCKSKSGVCQKCFGNDLTTNKPIEIGTAIGVIAAQSIGEPGTQLTMRTFHTGGAAGEANIAQGFERLKQLFDMIPPKTWELAVISEVNGVVREINKTETGYNIIVVNQMINEECVYPIGLNQVARVSVGDVVEAGDKLTDGSIDMKKLLRVAGIEAVRHYLIKEVQKVYRIQGIEINDKYIEVIVCQLTNKLKILNPGESNFFMGEITDINTFKDAVNNLLNANKIPPTAINIIFGLGAAPSKTGSFLSAASFQDTKKVLTDAAVKGQIDYLRGLKENVMLGNLIPAGTGLISSEEIIANGEKMYEKEY